MLLKVVILMNLTISSIVECLDIVAPKRRVRIQNKWQRKQWFTDEVRQSVRQRNEAYKIARISGSNND